MNTKPALLAAALTLAGASACSSTSESAEHRPPTTTTPKSVVVYRTPTCGCCKSYEDYLRRHGYTIESKELDNLEPIRTAQGIPDNAASCHTVVVDDYAAAGHVPVEAIAKLLTEKPDADGIALPGMPANSPGMGEPNGVPLQIVLVNDGRTEPFVAI